jgi:hypothetical protein
MLTIANLNNLLSNRLYSKQMNKETGWKCSNKIGGSEEKTHHQWKVKMRMIYKISGNLFILTSVLNKLERISTAREKS